jgi:acyl carrier protein
MREIHDFLVNEIAVERESFAPDENLLAQGIVDSMAILRLVGFLESRFGIKVSEDEMVPEHFETLAALHAFVERKAGR